SQPKANGTPWNTAGVVQLDRNNGLLCMELGTVSRAPVVELSHDADGVYELQFVMDNHVIARERLPQGSETSLVVSRVPTPIVARGYGYDELRLRPLGGDANCSIGHLLVIDE